MQEAYTSDDGGNFKEDESLTARLSQKETWDMNEFNEQAEEVNSKYGRKDKNYKDVPKTEGELIFESRLEQERKSYIVPKNYTNLNE